MLFFCLVEKSLLTKKRKHEILDKEEGRFGGITKAMSRIQKHYFGISRSELSDFFGGSLRRQLKARYQKTQRFRANSL